jgi:hypothetical protein
MDLYTAINERRTIRDFQDKEIDMDIQSSFLRSPMTLRKSFMLIVGKAVFVGIRRRVLS